MTIRPVVGYVLLIMIFHYLINLNKPTQTVICTAATTFIFAPSKTSGIYRLLITGKYFIKPLVLKGCVIASVQQVPLWSSKVTCSWPASISGDCPSVLLGPFSLLTLLFQLSLQVHLLSH